MKNTIINDAWRENLETKIIANDWYILPVIILISIVAVIAFVGVDNFVEVMSQFIVGIRAN